MNDSDPAVVYDADEDRGTISYANGVVVELQFQHGPIGEVGGVNNEDVLLLLGARLRAFNLRFPCRENEIAITKIDEALLWLQHRTRVRRRQGVEGRSRAHVS